MNTLRNDSGIRNLDLDMVKHLFNVKASSIEELEEHATGMWSTQAKVMELKSQLINFLSSYKSRNSIFYIFLGDEREHNLKIIVTSVLDEPDETTKRFAITIEEDFTDFKVKQLSLSSKLLTLVEV